MKIQKTNLALRILLLPFKLIFQLAFQILFGIKLSVQLSVQWVLFGGDELVYASKFSRANIIDLIEAVEKLTDENRKGN